MHIEGIISVHLTLAEVGGIFACLSKIARPNLAIQIRLVIPVGFRKFVEIGVSCANAIIWFVPAETKRLVFLRTTPHLHAPPYAEATVCERKADVVIDALLQPDVCNGIFDQVAFHIRMYPV